VKGPREHSRVDDEFVYRHVEGDIFTDMKPCGLDELKTDAGRELTYNTVQDYGQHRQFMDDLFERTSLSPSWTG
jgi:hypothetical protein